MDAKAGRASDGSPFLATMFHAVGLNVIDARERKSDVLDESMREVRDMIATSWLRTTEPSHTHWQGRNFTYIVPIVHTACIPHKIVPQHLLAIASIGLHRAACIYILNSYCLMELRVSATL